MHESVINARIYGTEKPKKFCIFGSMTNRTQPIGVFDSGVGGLTVLRKLANLLPDEDLLYLGDTARVPYGNKSAETIRLYAHQCAQFLLDQSVKLIVVACNTVSAVALQTVLDLSPVPVIGTIEPAAQAVVRASRSGNIGVIGTYTTVSSKAYDRMITSLDAQSKTTVYSQACPLFVPLAEEGWHYHAATRLIAEEYLAPLKQAGVDTLILGCTHYPQLIDSGEESALVAKDILSATASEHAPQRERRIDCYVTDKPAKFGVVAERFLGFPLRNIHQIAIDELPPLHSEQSIVH
jgi:glutamate racemase